MLNWRIKTIVVMKSIVSIMLIVVFSMPAVAQINQDKALYELKVIKYTKMKKTGTALAVLGGILFTTGTIVMLNSSITTIEDGYGHTEPIPKALLISAPRLSSWVRAD
jgi:hypothetical protein